jgi:hypothetical protein
MPIVVQEILKKGCWCSSDPGGNNKRRYQSWQSS